MSRTKFFFFFQRKNQVTQLQQPYDKMNKASVEIASAQNIIVFNSIA